MSCYPILGLENVKISVFLAMSSFARLARVKIVFVPPRDLGIAGSGGSFSGVADVSSMFSHLDGVTALAAGSISFAGQDACADAASMAWSHSVSWSQCCVEDLVETDMPMLKVLLMM